MPKLAWTLFGIAFAAAFALLIVALTEAAESRRARQELRQVKNHFYDLREAVVEKATKEGNAIVDDALAEAARIRKEAAGDGLTTAAGAR